MDAHIIWLTKLLLAHLLSDFIFQPRKWIDARNRNHFASYQLYLHGAVTAAAALLLVGYQYWPVVLVILVTHVLIDGWKSYQADDIKYFLFDQSFHLFIIVACWYFTFFTTADLKYVWERVNTKNVWILATAFLCVTQPASILIAQATKGWRMQIPNSDSLGNAGKWIGVIERLIIVVLILNHQYASVGLLLTAKSLLRFNEPNRLEVKTEYLVIGTLISFGIAALTAIIALKAAGV